MSASDMRYPMNHNARSDYCTCRKCTVLRAEYDRRFKEREAAAKKEQGS